MRFGYACINLSIKGKFTTCRLDRATERGLPLIRGLAYNNFIRTLEIIKWNIQYGLEMYRLSSDLIPFGSHELCEGWEWWNDPYLTPVLTEIRRIVAESGIRITIHPGQYNVLNSHSSDVVKKTIIDLIYQERLLRAMGGNDMILHVGGHYGYKKNSADRFVTEYNSLPPQLKGVLRIENDDKTFTMADVIEIVDRVNGKIMYDFHHDFCNPSISNQESKENILRIWGNDRIKVHISSGRSHPRDRSHSDYITRETWEDFKETFGDIDMDIMVEAKHKELAAFRLQTMHGSNVLQRKEGIQS